MKLVTRSQTSEILRKFGFRLSRDLGQNFLVDDNILQKILSASDLGPNDTILEIGAGIGTLTEALAKKVAKVISVEIDHKLIPILSQTLSGCENVKIINADVLDLDVGQLAFNGASATKMVSNLPYSVAAPVILKCFIEQENISEMVVMVQREIAERILADPGNKNYGAFTVKLRYFCRAEKLMTVSRHSFLPEPNINSMVIKLTRWEKPPVGIDRHRLFELVGAGFGQRRKMLVNSVSGVLKIDKALIEAAQEAAGLSKKIRAENLTLTEFARLAEKLQNLGHLS